MDPIVQRLSSVILYTLPLKASIPFGVYLFYKYPFLKVLEYVTYPAEMIEKSLPLGGSLLLFLILYGGLVRNPQVPYFIRYNACQALLINISLIIISYLFQILPLDQLGSILFILGSIVFLFILCIFIYSITQCIYGVEPEIPFISRSVRMQI